MKLHPGRRRAGQEHPPGHPPVLNSNGMVRLCGGRGVGGVMVGGKYGRRFFGVWSRGWDAWMAGGPGVGGEYVMLFGLSWCCGCKLGGGRDLGGLVGVGWGCADNCAGWMLLVGFWRCGRQSLHLIQHTTG